MTDLRRLGADVRAELGEPPATFAERQRLRLRGVEVGRPVQRRAPLVFAAVGTGALAVAAALWLSWGVRSSDETARQRPGQHVGPSAGEQRDEAAASGAEALPSAAVWVEASAAPASHRLTDGSTVALEAGARGRLDQGGLLGTRFDLHEGTASFVVEKQGAKLFSVVAGEYRVVVIGTRFTTTYLPPRELRVVVTEGVVQVHAPDRTTPISVSAGETLELHGEEFSLQKGESVLEGGREAGAKQASASGQPSSARPSWQSLYRAGKYQEACEVARAGSVAQLRSSLDAGGLLDLSSTLRLCGDAAGAMTSLDALRARFPATPQAHDALFLMGRILATQGKSKAAIARLDQYLAAGSGGRFTAEALGRLIELHQALGSHDSARRAALRYLEVAPAGPYQRLAEGVAKQP